jgi:hypothetical protein
MVLVGMMAGLRALLRESTSGKFKKAIPGGRGGDTLRKLIRQFMGEKPAPSPIENSDPSDIFLNDTKIAQGRILSDNRLYVKLVDIVKPLGMRLGKVQGGDQRFINLISDNLRPKFLADSPLLQGFNTVDIYLNRPVDGSGIPVGVFGRSVEPFMGGILIGQSTYILLGDFCNELGIAAEFDQNDKSFRLSL